MLVNGAIWEIETLPSALTPVTTARRSPINRRMTLASRQYFFWYFGYPTPLAPAEDRLA